MTPVKEITAKYRGTCRVCRGDIVAGQRMMWQKDERHCKSYAYHLRCYSEWDRHKPSNYFVAGDFVQLAVGYAHGDAPIIIPRGPTQIVEIDDVEHLLTDTNGNTYHVDWVDHVSPHGELVASCPCTVDVEWLKGELNK